MRLAYNVHLFTYWHAGSGLSGGAEANNTVIKDIAGLPFIPGRTLKGMLREAAESMEGIAPGVDSSFIKRVFGLSEDDESMRGKSTYRQSSCFFSDAQLSSWTSQHIDDAHKPLLYDRLAATAIDEHGQAQDGTLRQMEVTIPMTLYAFVTQFPDDPQAKQAFEYCLQWVKYLGVNRTRGLGRCQLSLFELQSEKP